MNLYLVKLRGMQSSATGAPHGIAYVVAENAEDAYWVVKKNMDDEDLGFEGDRELDSIQLLATDKDFQYTPKLYLSVNGDVKN